MLDVCAVVFYICVSLNAFHNFCDFGFFFPYSYIDGEELCFWSYNGIDRGTAFD